MKATTRPKRSDRNGGAACSPGGGERVTISPGEFHRLRKQVESFLEQRFRRLSSECREEVVNDAFLALHRARRRSSNFNGEPAQALAYLKRAARSLAIDRTRRAKNPARSAEPRDPCGRLLSELRAAAPSPQDQVEAELSERQVAELAEALPAQEAGVVKRSVLWGWTPELVMADLGLTRRRYELLRARALLKVARRLEEEGGELWARGKARLIAALVEGTATAVQARQARALAKQSAEFRLALAKYEETLHSVAAAIPADVALGAHHRTGLMERAIAAVDRAWDAVGGVVGGGGGETAQQTLSQQLGSGATRGAGAAGGGVLAKLGGSGIGAKIAAACLAGGAAAGSCIAAGVVPGVDLPGLHGSSTQARPSAGPAPDDTGALQSLPSGAQPADSAPPPSSTDPGPGDPATEPGAGQTTTTTTTTQPPPPPVQTEFGAEPSAASSPTSPAGSGGSGGGGGSAVQREFGP
jgi:RNA polymerase sigma factor (sigma-70 family)